MSPVSNSPKSQRIPKRLFRGIQVHQSPVHGKGVFAKQDFKMGETITEYLGEIITWDEALKRHPHDPNDPFHTFYFHLDDECVIDGKFGGSEASWINHSCDPNAEADETDGRVFIRAVRDIKAGEEIHYDYGLVIDARYTAKLKSQYLCRCNALACRGTLLAPKKRR